MDNVDFILLIVWMDIISTKELQDVLHVQKTVNRVLKDYVIRALKEVY